MFFFFSVHSGLYCEIILYTCIIKLTEKKKEKRKKLERENPMNEVALSHLTCHQRQIEQKTKINLFGSIMEHEFFFSFLSVSLCFFCFAFIFYIGFSDQVNVINCMSLFYQDFNITISREVLPIFFPFFVSFLVTVTYTHKHTHTQHRFDVEFSQWYIQHTFLLAFLVEK